MQCNTDGMTAVHFAIEFERLDCLVYMFEGETVDISDYSIIMNGGGKNGVKNEDIDQMYFSKLSKT